MTMRRQPLYSIMLGVTIAFTVAALLTLVPFASSAKSLLGYRALCSFAPVSTILLAILAGFTCAIRKRVAYGASYTPLPPPRGDG
jgi:hypothetical protein